jgi:hypothetical protein
MRRVRAALAFALALTLLSGCGLLPTTAPTPTQLEGPGPALLPGSTDLVPSGSAGVGGWQGTTSFPSGFDATTTYATPDAVGEELAAALAASYTGGLEAPTYTLASFTEADDRVVLVLTELGAGDDSILGSQYALVADASAEGWRLTELYARPICRRGVSGALCV